jgi:hypothetical protein
MTTCEMPLTCTYRQTTPVPESLGVAATADGRVWATYLWQQVDQDVAFTCLMKVTQDRSTVTLVVAEVPLDGSPVRSAWSAVVGGPMGATNESIAPRGRNLLVPITLGGTSIRYLDLDTTGL